MSYGNTSLRAAVSDETTKILEKYENSSHGRRSSQGQMYSLYLIYRTK